MPDNWTISVAGRSYGPYSTAQMEAFAAEGRLAPHSLVQRAGEQRIRAASEDPDLASLFQQAKTPAPVFSPLRADAPASSFGRQDQAEGTGERSHFVIIADMKSRSVTGLEEEIFNLGPAHAVLPQVWILSATASVNAVRNILVQKLGKLDTLFVVDASHNKAAWFNFGPESESRIRRIWAKSMDVAARRSSAN